MPMTMRTSGIRDVENVLGIHHDSVMAIIKFAAAMIVEKPPSTPKHKQTVRTAELDEFWSFVGSKANRYWTWYAWDAQENCILVHQNGRRTDASCRKLCDKPFAKYDI